MKGLGRIFAARAAFLRLDPVLWHMLVKQDDVIEYPHHRHDCRDAALLARIDMLAGLSR